MIGMVTGSGSSAIVQRFSYDSSGSVVSVDYSADNGSTFTTYYYLRNGQGDIVKLIDASGTTVVEYTYDSWGQQLSCTGSLSTSLGANQPFCYRGYVYDAETGWYYLQSRYYNPETCMFISADVVMSTGQGVLGYNTFAYCLNNPLNSSDPSGFFSWGQMFTCIAIVAVAAVAVVATVATAGAAGAAIGTVVGVHLGASAAAAATTAVTVGAYAVAAGIAVCAASDVGEVCTGTNVVRDYVCGGDQGVYDTVKTVLYTTSAFLCTVGATYNQACTDSGSNNASAPYNRGTGKAPKLEAALANGTYDKVDNNGAVMSTAYYDAYGRQCMRYDYFGHSHAGVSPHIHMQSYNENGYVNFSAVYNMTWNRID